MDCQGTSGAHQGIRYFCDRTCRIDKCSGFADNSSDGKNDTCQDSGNCRWQDHPEYGS